MGGSITGGTALVDAQLVGFVNTTLSFQASAQAPVGTSAGAAASYKYGVYLIYDLGYGAYATIEFFPNWALTKRYAYNPAPRFTIYEGSGTFLGPTRKRSIEAPKVVQPLRFPRKPLLDSWKGVKFAATKEYIDSTDSSREAKWSDGNRTSGIDVEYLLGKRADSSGDANMLDASTPDFTQQLTCPPRDTAQRRLPDFLSKFAIFPSKIRDPKVTTRQ